MSMAETAHAITLGALGTAEIARGVSRLLLGCGMSPLIEFSLPNGRRLDVAAIANDGAIIGVEIKISIGDLLADAKWPEYLGFCDLFYFAVPPDFPQQRIPQEPGLIVADRFGGAIVRESPRTALHPSRRRSLTLSFAQTAAFRLARGLDPQGWPGAA